MRCVACDTEFEPDKYNPNRRKFCTDKCNKNFNQKKRRAERREIIVFKHPRCVVCNKPMRYKKSWGGPGANYGAVTCSRKCAYTRANWFRKEPKMPTRKAHATS